MASYRLLLAIFLSLFVSAAFGLRSAGSQLSSAQQCRLQRLTSSQPSRSIESEGGVVEFWDENEEQFQCAGVAPLRIVVRPNSIHLPSFHPTPRLVYVVQGKGLLGLTIPGCAETYTSQQPQQQQQQQQQQEQPQQQQEQQEQQQFQRGDHHQRVRRIRRGDVIAVPAGAAHWCANDDEQEDLVVITINDLNHLSNQLDQRFRVFYLAGGSSRQQQQGQQGQQPWGQQGQHGQQPWGQKGQQGPRQFQNLFRGFDPELLSEAFNIPVDTARKIQREDERGLIVTSQQGLRGILRPGREGEEQEEQQEQGQWGGGGEGPYNGIEETFCAMKVHTNLDRRTQADVYSRQAGKINIVDRPRMPILKYFDMSIEKGNLHPHALVSPHWTTNGHCIMYVVSGDAQVEAVNHLGQNVMNDRVNERDMVVIPQFFAATIKAGSNGFEWVAVHTTATPLKSPLAGYTSVLRAMPLEVVRHSYQTSPGEAQQLKLNRGTESVLLSSSQQRGRPY